jgi:glycerol-3-phosphate dehydrogenase
MYRVPALSPEARREALERMACEPLDVLVVGGGVVGAGCALDAATRGLRVGLVEARDYASGTSSRSSKLIHGGLRYLEQMEFGLVREALRERSLILDRLCPHLATAIPFLLPLQHRAWERAYIGAGVMLYDTLGGRKGIPGHRHLTRGAALRRFPSLRRDSLIGAIQYYDGQVDDARHTFALVRTAAQHGALVANSSRVVGFIREGDAVVGARVLDVETGQEIQVRAKHVINAPGVWTDEIQQLVGGRGRLGVRASKGVHILVPRERIHGQTGIISRTEKSVLFIIPWGAQWIIGTTDTDWALDLAHPAATRADIDYLLTHANRLLMDPLTHDDIVGVYAGLRPLLSGESDDTSQLSREHTVVSPVPGLTMIAGGKYTTYRVMAMHAVDAAARALGGRIPQSCTHEVPLVGAEGFRGLWNRRARLASDAGMHLSQMEHLLRRHGSLVHEILDLINDQPDLARPIRGAGHYLAAEAFYAVAAEGALHLDDVLTRRTRASIDTTDRGVVAAEEVADLIAPLLGWDDETKGQEVQAYKDRVLAERESQRQPDDASADAVRLNAPEFRRLLKINLESDSTTTMAP